MHLLRVKWAYSVTRRVEDLRNGGCTHILGMAVVVRLRHIGKLRHYLSYLLPLVRTRDIERIEILPNEGHDITFGAIPTEKELRTLVAAIADDDGVTFVASLTEHKLYVSADPCLAVETVAE